MSMKVDFNDKGRVVAHSWTEGVKYPGQGHMSESLKDRAIRAGLIKEGEPFGKEEASLARALIQEAREKEGIKD